MKHRISDLLEGYEAQDVAVETDSGLDIGRVETLVMAQCAPAKRRGGWRGVRIGLIAAAAALVLGAAAVAAYSWNLNERVVEAAPESVNGWGEDLATYSTVGGLSEEASSVSDETVTLTGSGSESAALEEWTAYYFAEHDVESFQPLADNDMVGEIYMIGYQEMKDELERIAKKYDLRLMQDQTLYTSLTEAYEALSIEAVTPWEPYNGGAVGSAMHTMVYDDGSFQMQMYVEMPEGVSNGEKDELFFRLHCAKKGTLYNGTEGGGDPANYQTESYTTAGGTPVELALGTMYSMIFAELDDCYVTIHLSGGYEPSEYLPYLDMADMETIADCFDFAQLG